MSLKTSDSDTETNENPFTNLFGTIRREFSLKVPEDDRTENKLNQKTEISEIQTKPLQIQSNEKMSIEIKDVITAIPIFSGNKKDLETFINTCDLYIELISEANRPNLIRVIKTKITGEALAKISPTSSLITWPAIRKKLKEKINRTVSVEFAREDLNNVKQLKDESIEAYSNRIRAKLRSLNEAIKETNESDIEMAVIRRINEKHAISKFEQNIRNNTLRILVSAAAKDSLDDCIMFALQKDLLTNSNTTKKCNNCGMTNHDTSDCRRSKNNYNNPKQKDYGKMNNGNANREFYRNNGSSFSNNNGSSSSNSNGRNSNNNGRNFGNNGKQFGNNNQNQNNIKSILNNDDDITLRDIIDEDSEDTSYQINNFHKTDDNNVKGTQYCEIKFSMRDNEIIIEIPTSISNEDIKFCVDTGAQVSVIKPQKILDAKINVNNKINIMGVAKNAKLQSLGVVRTHLHCKNLRILHDFHVLNKNFNIKVDGIIGNDLLKKTGAKIDFDAQTIQMRLPQHNLKHDFNNIHKFRFSSEYDDAVSNYLRYETRYINTLKLKKHDKNPEFYTNLSNLLFEEEKFEKNINQPIIPGETEIFSENNLNPMRNIFTFSKQRPITDPQQRSNILMKKIKLDGLTGNQRDQIEKLCFEYNEAFYIEGDNLTTTDIYQHSIKLKPDVDTVFVKQYRIPETQKEEVNRQINDLLKNNIIEKSTSRFNSPLLLVKKRSDETEQINYRMVIDYRKLNDSTIDQSYPIPLIDEITDNLHQSEVFTVLDVFSAFHQILLREDCRQYTAFSTSNAHYQFRCTPFGLQSSPIAWLYTINGVLRDFTNKNLFWYMDDIIIHEVDDRSNIKIIKKVLGQLIKHHIKLKPEKCSFLQKSVKFLGYKISGNGLEIDESRIRCIKLYPRPTNVQEVQRFCGFVNFYRKWVFDFAKTAKPLYNLCKKEVKFEWNTGCENAFLKLKQSLITPPVLAFPRFDQDFILSTDASKISCSGILANRDGRDERPIQYFSRTLNEAQSRYSAIELELLAIIWSVEWFRSYLYGRKFYIYTDHKPLIYLFGNQNMSCRLHRWRLILMEYNFEVIHREGKANVGPDALSRIAIGEENESTNEKTIFMVKTRSRDHNSKSPLHDDIYTPGSSKSNFYYIEERRNLTFSHNEHDHIFYLLDRANTRMHKHIQYKLKKAIDISELKYGEILKIDDNKSIAIVPSFLRQKFQIEYLTKTLRAILTFSTHHNYENIAFNIDQRDPRSYFEFKMISKQIFQASNTKMIFYLNMILELTDIDDINLVLNNFHNTLLGGHASFERMHNNIRRSYHWHNMSSDIKNYVRMCDICQRGKITRHTKQPLLITSIPLTCFETVFIDHIGKINPPADGKAYILTLMCDLSKFAIAIAVSDNGAETTARNLVEKVFIKYGFPSKIVSDNHKSFTGDTMKQISKILKINQVFTSPYTPSSNVVERLHRTLGNYLRTFINENPNRWPDVLDYAVWAYNNTIHTGTNYSPFELVYGRSMSLPDTIARTVPSYTYDNYVDELKMNLKTSWNLARDNLLKKKELNKKSFDDLNNTQNLDLKIGDFVFIRKQNKNHKFDNNYDGPYKVIQLTGPNSVRIQNRKGKIISTHKNKLKLTNK